METKPKNQSIGALASLVSKNLPYGSTLREIRLFLEKQLRYRIPKSKIEAIGKVLRQKRISRIDELVVEFRKLHSTYSKQDFRNFFENNGIHLSRNELKNHYPDSPLKLISFRVSEREAQMIERFSAQMNLNRSTVKRLMMVAGLASLTSDTPQTLGRISLLYRHGINIPPMQFEFLRMTLIGSGWFRMKPEKNQ